MFFQLLRLQHRLARRQGRARVIGCRRHRRNQLPCVVLLRRTQYLSRCACFDVMALLQHQHAVGNGLDHGKVVGDKQHRHALLTLDAPQQIEDLPLRGHVQCRGRLVRNQQLRREGQRHGDHHALALATGQLKRVGMVEPLRVRQADIAEQFDNPCTTLGAVFHAMGLQGFVDLSTHAE